MYASKGELTDRHWQTDVLIMCAETDRAAGADAGPSCAAGLRSCVDIESGHLVARLRDRLPRCTDWRVLSRAHGTRQHAVAALHVRAQRSKQLHVLLVRPVGQLALALACCCCCCRCCSLALLGCARLGRAHVRLLITAEVLVCCSNVLRGALRVCLLIDAARLAAVASRARADCC